MEADDQPSGGSESWPAMTSSPCVYSVIVLAVFGFVALWVGYGRGIESWAMAAQFSPILVFFLMRAELGRGNLCDRPAPIGISSIAWPSVLWTITLVYYGGAGITLYLPGIVRDWLLEPLLAIGPIVFLISMREGIPLTWSDLGFRKRCLPRTVGCLVVVCATFVPVIVGGWLAGAVGDLTTAAWIDLLITSTMMPAIFEEIAFRGLIQEAFSAKYGSRLSGLFMASLFFGFGHIFTNAGAYNDVVLGFLLSIALQFLFGMLNGAVYEVTGNLTAPIVLHYLNNFNASLGRVKSFGYFATSYLWLGISFAIAVALFVAAWSRIRSIPRYVAGLYGFVRRILRCIAGCIQAELRRAIE